MAQTKTRTEEIVKEHRRSESDTGSPEIQIALLTNRILYLTDHAKGHGKDHQARRGLLKLVGQRRRILDYIKRADVDRYRTLIQRLGIRK